jgi:hypothetical protein
MLGKSWGDEKNVVELNKRSDQCVKEVINVFGEYRFFLMYTLTLGKDKRKEERGKK